MGTKIKMLALDLDGTVFNNKKEITLHTQNVLEQAMKLGVVVLPATGRPASGLPQVFLDIPGVRYALTSNGARILDVNTGMSVYEAAIPWDRAISILQELRTWEHSVWEVYYDGKVYVDADEYRFLDHPDISPAFKQYMYDTRIFTKSLMSKLKNDKQNLEKIHLIFDDTDNRNQKIPELMRAYPEFEMRSATTFDLDINVKEAAKGTALIELGKILGIQKEEIMACGDAENDWDMLKKVGFPVVMGNADEDTKKLARFVTLTNEEDGVAYAVEQFILNEKWG